MCEQDDWKPLSEVLGRVLNRLGMKERPAAGEGAVPRVGDGQRNEKPPQPEGGSGMGNECDEPARGAPPARRWSRQTIEREAIRANSSYRHRMVTAAPLGTRRQPAFAATKGHAHVPAGCHLMLREDHHSAASSRSSSMVVTPSW